MTPLKVQEYLRSGKTLEDLKSEYGIKFSKDVNNELVVLNYDQIDSKKTEMIVQECRGLILKIGTWRIISKSFHRFFNYGEVSGNGAEYINLSDIDLSKCTFLEKRDGSLVSVFWYNQQWRIATRGSIDATGTPLNAKRTFNDMISEVLLPVYDELDTRFNYIFEITAPDNQIVTMYDKTELRLIAMRRTVNWKELDNVEMLPFANKINIELPREFFASTYEDIMKVLSTTSYDFEGVVAINYNEMDRWGNFNRVKIKKDEYIALHHMLGNISTDRAILALIIKGEQDEVITHFPNYTEKIESISQRYDKYIERMKIEETDIRFKIKNNVSKKEFAISIKNSKFKPYFFSLFDGKCKDFNDYLNNNIESRGMKIVTKKLVEEL